MVNRLISRLYPAKIKKKFYEALHYCNIKTHPDKFIGLTIIIGLVASIALAFLLRLFINLPVIIMIIALFIISQLMIYFSLVLYSDNKARIVENILPDALQLMSSNLKAGLTTDRAVLLAARPEFGPLQEELNNIGKKIAVGKDLGESLIDISKRINSHILNKTMWLIKSGLESGGNLAPLLEQTAENLRQQQLIDKKIRSNVIMYVIFIFAATAFGAPLLFALSSFLVNVLAINLAQVSIPETAMSQIPITLTKVSVDPTFVVNYAVVFIIVNSILGALIIGLIHRGKERAGIKFIPVVMSIALILFFLVRYILKTSFSELFGM